LASESTQSAFISLPDSHVLLTSSGHKRSTHQRTHHRMFFILSQQLTCRPYVLATRRFSHSRNCDAQVLSNQQQLS